MYRRKTQREEHQEHQGHEGVVILRFAPEFREKLLAVAANDYMSMRTFALRAVERAVKAAWAELEASRKAGANDQ